MFDVSNVRSGAYWNLNRIYKGLEQATVDHSVDHSSFVLSNEVLFEDPFYDLPRTMRNDIYGHIYELANRPETNDCEWGSNNVFRDLPRLQRAVQLVAFNSFCNLPVEQKKAVAERIWINAGCQQGDPNWGENHANDDAKILLKSLIEVMCPSKDTILNPAGTQIHGTWREEGEINGSWIIVNPGDDNYNQYMKDFFNSEIKVNSGSGDVLNQIARKEAPYESPVVIAPNFETLPIINTPPTTETPPKKVETDRVVSSWSL